MLIPTSQETSTPTPAEATPAPPAPPQATRKFEETFVGRLLISVTVAIVASYVTNRLIKRRGGG